MLETLLDIFTVAIFPFCLATVFYYYNGIIYLPGDTIKNICGSFGQGIQVRNHDSCILFIEQFSVVNTAQGAFLQSSNINNTPCSGSCTGSITNLVSSVSGSLFSFNGGTYSTQNSFYNLCPGYYSIGIKTPNGCENFYSLEVKKNNPEFINVIATPTSCEPPNNDGAITFDIQNGTPPISFSLNGATPIFNNSFNNLTNGLYTIVAKDAVNCTSSKVVAITTAMNPFLNSIDINNISCFNLNDGKIDIQFTGVGNINYTLMPTNITNNTGVFTDLSDGIYSIFIEDSKHCKNNYPFLEIKRPDSIFVVNVSSKENNCFTNSNGEIQFQVIGGIPPTNYSNSVTHEINSTGIFNNLKDGYYDVFSFDSKGCSLHEYITIDKDPNSLSLTEAYTKENCSENNNSVEIFTHNGYPPFKYYWNGVFSSLSKKENISSKFYEIKVKDSIGCVESVSADLSILLNCCELTSLPNAFSPNGDNINDFFGFINSTFISLEAISIYDRWGKMVFTSTNPEIKWEGHNFSGEECPIGTYYYYAKYTAIFLMKRKL